MTQVNKIDSNATGLRYAEETTYNTAPSSATWYALEPNEYDDFGGEYTLIARNPINSSRQRKKGVITDLDASGGFETDLTQDNLTDIMQGFMFATIAQNGEDLAADATGTTDLFDIPATAAYAVGQIVQGSGYANAGNNGLHVVTAIVADTTIAVTGSTLVTETAPATAKVETVGFEFVTADANSLTIDASGAFPTITTDIMPGGWLVDLNVEAGDWIYIGDGTNDFFNSANNGFKRVRSVTATVLTLDKSDSTMITDDGSTTGSAGAFATTIRIFVSKKLKNRQSSSIVRRSYHLERELGYSDDGDTANLQYEYVTGAIPSEFELTIPVADKVMANVSFMGASTDRIDTSTTSPTGGETRIDAGGSRPTLVDADAFNTSSDVARVRLATYDSTTEAPTPLFTYAEEITLSLNNNLNPLKAVGTLGSFDVSAGTFEVSGEITAYFADVASVDTIANNSDITLDVALYKANAGIMFDIPLIALGEGRMEVEQDEAIKIPLDMQAASAAKLHADLDHTLWVGWFSYLPAAAATQT